MDSHVRLVFLGCLVLVLGFVSRADGEVSQNTVDNIIRINKEGPHLGIVVPNSFEMSPLLQSSSFVADHKLPYLDFGVCKWALGLGKSDTSSYRWLHREKVSNRAVRTREGHYSYDSCDKVEHDLTTKLLLSLFKVKGVLHFGIAGNANPDLQIGDVTIPQYWAHTGLWNFQRYGDGPEDEVLALESSGDYTRKLGYLEFSNYNNDTKNEQSPDNLPNIVWHQPEKIFSVTGTPEVRQHAFWVPVDKHYFSLVKRLEGMRLEGCVNSTCLPRTPVVKRVQRGISANVFIDNGAYREFLYSKFNLTAIDMESAAVANVCLELEKPFIAIRALSDLAGGGSSVSNEAAIFASVAAQNAADVAVQFISLLSQ